MLWSGEIIRELWRASLVVLSKEDPEEFLKEPT
jgi:hypothetical protein